jgi:hypothetical protein
MILFNTFVRIESKSVSSDGRQRLRWEGTIANKLKYLINQFLVLVLPSSINGTVFV